MHKRENKLMSLDMVINIINELNSVVDASSEISVKAQLYAIIENLENELIKHEHSGGTEKLLLEKLNESKRKYPELNARLYILYQDFRRGKVSDADALEKMNILFAAEEFGKMVVSNGE